MEHLKIAPIPIECPACPLCKRIATNGSMVSGSAVPTAARILPTTA